MAVPPCCRPIPMAACRWRWTAMPAPPAPGVTAPSVITPKARPERHVQTKAPQAHVAKASYHIGDYQPAANPALSNVKAGLETVAVKNSEAPTIDGGAIAVPSISGGMAMAAPPSAQAADRNDASHCLKVDSDGGHWGFRNACDFAVQFAYCMAGGDGLAARGRPDAGP